METTTSLLAAIRAWDYAETLVTASPRSPVGSQDPWEFDLNDCEQLVDSALFATAGGMIQLRKYRIDGGLRYSLLAPARPLPEPTLVLLGKDREHRHRGAWSRFGPSLECEIVFPESEHPTGITGLALDLGGALIHEKGGKLLDPLQSEPRGSVTLRVESTQDWRRIAQGMAACFVRAARWIKKEKRAPPKLFRDWLAGCRVDLEVWIREVGTRSALATYLDDHLRTFRSWLDLLGSERDAAVLAKKFSGASAGLKAGSARDILDRAGLLHDVCGEALAVHAPVSVPIVMAMPFLNDAVVAYLVVEIVETPQRGVPAYQDPVAALQTWCSGTFLRSVKDAFRAALRIAQDQLRAKSTPLIGLDRLVLEGKVTARFKVIQPNGLTFQGPIEGASGSLGAACAFLGALLGQALDPRIIYTGEVLLRAGASGDGIEDWLLRGVSMVSLKALRLAAEWADRFDTLVVIGRRDAGAARRGFEGARLAQGSAKSDLDIVCFAPEADESDHQSVSLAGVERVARFASGVLMSEIGTTRVFDIRSALANEVLRYLDAVEIALADLVQIVPGWIGSNENLTGLARIRQSVRVVDEQEARRTEDQDRDLETRAYAQGRSLSAPYAAHDLTGEVNRNGKRSGHGDKWNQPALEIIEWDEAARDRYRRAVFLGPAGYGKTVHLVSECLWWIERARQSIRVPPQSTGNDPESSRSAPLFDLPLPFFFRAAVLATSQNELTDEIREVVKRHTPAFRKLIEDRLPRPDQRVDPAPLALLIDGLDEVGDDGARIALSARIGRFIGAAVGARVLMSSRGVGYHRIGVGAVAELELIPFDDGQVSRFVRAWVQTEAAADLFLAQLAERSESARSMMRVPLLLALSMGLSEIPERPTELLRECIFALVESRIQKRLGSPAWDWAKKNIHAVIDIHAAVARELLEARLQALGSGRRLGAILRKDLEAAASKVIAATTARAEWRFRLPPNRDDLSFRFLELVFGCGVFASPAPRDGMEAVVETSLPVFAVHRSFLEWLCAHALAVSVDAEGLEAVRSWIDDYSWVPANEDIMVHFGGLLGSKNKLHASALLAAIQAKCDDHGYRLALCAQLAAEMPADVAGRERVAEAAFIAHSENFLVFDRLVPACERACPALARMKPDLIAELVRDMDGFHERRYGNSLPAFAAGTLAAMSRQAARPDVLSALMRLLRCDAVDCRGAAVRALLAMVACDRDNVLNALHAFISRRAVETRINEITEDATAVALEVLRRLNVVAVREDILDLIKALIDTYGGSTCRNAIWVLRAMGSAAARRDILDSLLRLFHHSDEDLRKAAAQGLGRMNCPEAHHHISMGVDSLLEVIRRDSEESRRDAVSLLGSMGELAARDDVLDALCRLLGQDASTKKGHTIAALESMGPAAARPDILAALIALIDSNDEWTQIRAVIALSKMFTAPARDTSLDALHRLLVSEDSQRAWRAADVARDIGAAAARDDIVAALIHHLHGMDVHLRYGAANALIEMAVVEVRDEILDVLVRGLLVRGLDSNSRFERESALKSLSRMGPAAARGDVLDALLPTLRGQHQSKDAVRLITNMGPAGARADLVLALRDWHIDEANIAIVDLQENGLRFIDGKPFRVMGKLVPMDDSDSV